MDTKKNEGFEEPKIVEHEIQIPKFPRLLGPLGRLADAITPDIPYDFKALSIITCVGLQLSGRIRLASDPWLQTRFYSLNVGRAGGGKTAGCDEVLAALTPIIRYSVEPSIDSGPAHVEAFQENNYVLLFPDEMADQFEKAKLTGTSRNSIFGEWLRLFEKNLTGNRTKKDKRHGVGGQVVITNAHFAMLGGVAVERFPTMWQGAGATKSGLRSRFCLAYSEEIMPRLKTPNNDEAVRSAVAEIGALLRSAQSDDFYRPFVDLPLSLEAQSAIAGWRFGEDGDESFTRVLDKAKRFALLNAFCDSRSDVDGDVMQLGLAASDYWMAADSKLFEPDAANYVQAFENRIIKFFTLNPKATLDQLTQHIRPEKYLGGYEAFNRGWRALQNRVAPCGTTRKKKTVYEWQNIDEKVA
jgi:hypothetical protein